MFIKINNLLSSNGKCDTCRHSGICKHTDNMTKIEKEVAEIRISIGSPFLISMVCSKYEKRFEKQDGFYAR